MRFFYFIYNHTITHTIASHKFVIFDTKILIKASWVSFLFNKAITDLNSGQLVSVDKTRNQIIHFGAIDASAVKFTTGSRKYQLIKRIKIHRGRCILFISSSSTSISIGGVWVNFFLNNNILIMKEIVIQYK